jgi:CMP-N-acetylneuraminic acid synthetase
MSDAGAIAIVPARGGSKGIPGKNLVRLGGVPLIVRTIRAARGARTIGRIIVSTDSEEIARVARRAGAEVPFLRPRVLASDTASTEAVIRHALETLDDDGLPDIVVVLQPTSPLRTSGDIDGAVRLLRASGAPSVVSVCLVDHPVEWAYRRSPTGQLRPVVPAARGARRQDARTAVRLNGAVFVVRREAFLRTGRLRSDRTVGYLMPRERSLDIDEPLDLVTAEAWLSRAR